MKHKKFEQIAFDEAKASRCRQRQVGAVLVHLNTQTVIAQGHNYSNICTCGGEMGDWNCPPDVVHAEVACLNHIPVSWYTKENLLEDSDLLMYVTQPPCNECLQAIQEFNLKYNCIINTRTCEQFMKFDDDKIRFDLIPPEWPLALAKVLTYGAKKYKPNNWRKGDAERYKGAIHRHLNAYQLGEMIDEESGMSHLWLAMTNIGFLITLEDEKLIHGADLTVEFHKLKNPINYEVK